MRRIAVASLAVAAMITVSCGSADEGTLVSPSPAATAEPGVTLPPSLTKAPTTEPPTTAALDDGRHFGYVKGMDASAKTLVFDLAYFLSGEEANKAAAEDGVIEAGETVDNDYYIRNQNTRLRTVPYASSVKITLVNWPDCCSNPVDGDVSKFVASFQPSGKDDLYMGPDSQYWLTVQDGTVVQIEEQYLP